MEAHLIACVNESLAAFLYDNASFLCERLVACSPTQVRAPTLLSSQAKHCSMCHLPRCLEVCKTMHGKKEADSDTMPGNGLHSRCGSD